MAFHNSVRPAAAGICLLLAVATAAGKPNALTPKEAADGWVLLFDGETTFGWKTVGDVAVRDGALVLGRDGKGASVTLPAVPAELEVAFEADTPAGAKFTFMVGVFGLPWSEPRPGGWLGYSATYGLTTASGSVVGIEPVTSWNTKRSPGAGPKRAAGVPLVIAVEAGHQTSIRSLKARPTGTAPLFDGKSLAGWKRFAGNPKQEKSAFAVTPAGELSIKNGPGDLQTERQFADFLLQLECKTNGKALNSGVFFRCLPGQYQQGYEAQIQNAYLLDRTKPVDFGTGAIYRRVPARKVVSDDNEWFTLTVLAKGPQISTWVNGYPTVSWTDDREAKENARQGRYTKAGPISLQGHDPTTDLLFRNIRVAELKD